ncbi:MAG: T9SS type B sorting domain-containing protein [Luteibaculaceae bacterium]
MRKCLLSIFFLLSVIQAFAADFLFKPTADLSLSNPKNWVHADTQKSTKTVPGKADFLIIDADILLNNQQTLTVDEDLMVKGLLFKGKFGGVTLEIKKGAQLILTESLVTYKKLNFSGEGVLSFYNSKSKNASISVQNLTSKSPVLVQGLWEFDGNSSVLGAIRGENAEVQIKSGHIFLPEFDTNQHGFLKEQGGIVLRSTGLEANSNTDQEAIPFKGGDGSRNVVNCGFPPNEFQIEIVVVSNFNGRAISCNGASDAVLEVVISPAGNYTIEWAGGPSSAIWSNRGPGIALVTVTSNATGFECQTFFEVPDTPPLFNPTLQIISNPVCVDDCNGVVGANIIGGTAPYTFTWNRETANQFVGNPATNICRGPNTLRVTDANGCFIDRNFPVNLPLDFAANEVITNVSCFGGNDGLIVLNPSGSNGGPYTFLWGNGNTTNTLSNLTAGSYSVQIFDGANCLLERTFVVTQPAPIVITNESVTNLLCFEECIGSIDMSFVGGVEPFTFQWFNSADNSPIATQTDLDAQNLCAGTYFLRVTDANGCFSNSGNITVTQPEILTAIETISNVDCFGFDTGSLSFQAQGGVAPYTATLLNANGDAVPGGTSNPFLFDNLSAGSYTLTLTDANSCTFTAVYEILENDEIVFDSVAVNPACLDDGDGTITLSNVAGGIAPYSFEWTLPNGSTVTSQNLTSLAGGIYSVVITDALGCEATASFTLINPPAISITSTVTNSTCAGFSNGSISITPSGGTPNATEPFYTFNWTGPNTFTATSQNISNLVPGEYTVLITDAAGCTLTESFTITEPNPLNANAGITNVRCFGLSNGAINLNVFGGTQPFNFLWSTATNPNFATTQNLANLPAGNYTVNITDANNCSASFSFTVNQPDPLVADVVATDIVCFGDGNGTAIISATGGTAPYLVGTQGPNGFTADNQSVLSNLQAGSYTSIVSDANLCAVVLNFTIESPTELLVNVSKVDPSCSNSADGSLTATVQGGIEPYTILWTGPGGVTFTDFFWDNLGPGDYTFNVIDANGCETNSFLIVIGGSFQTGGIQIAPPPTNPNFIFNSPITITNFEPGQLLTSPDQLLSICLNLEHSWMADLEMRIVCPNGQFTSLYRFPNTTNEFNSCGGGTNLGNPNTGGQTPAFSGFDYCFTQNATITMCNAGVPFNIAQSLPAGNYLPDGDFADLIGCPLNGNWRVEVRDVFPQADNGFLYSWSLNFTADEQVVNVITLNAPNPIEVEETLVNPTCAGNLTNGSITLAVSGGALPLSFQWAGPNGFSANTQNITGLSAGTYSVTITDFTNCQETFSFTLVNPAEIEIVGNTTPLLCFGDANGFINITINGGTAPFSFQWVNVASPAIVLATTQNLSNVGAGTYRVTVTDAAQCTQVFQATINQPSPIEITNTIFTPVSCTEPQVGGILVEASGGSGSLDFIWTLPDGSTINNQGLTNVEAGIYALTITDGLGCSITETFTLPPAASLNISFTRTNNLCFGESNGALGVTVNQGVAPFIFSWTGPGGFTANTQNISNLINGTYAVTVVDANQCTGQLEIAVTSLPQITAIPTITNVNCAATANGAIAIEPGGGAGGYSFQWTGPNGFTANTQNIVGLIPGTYNLVISDQQNCSRNFSFQIQESDPIDVDIVVSNIDCIGDLVNVTTTITGGIPPYSFTWTGPNGFSSTSLNLQNVGAGVFTISGTDAANCPFSETLDLTEPNGLRLFAGITPVDCFGESTGAIILTILGGTAPYSVLWTFPDGSTSTDVNLSNLLAGDYTILVTDANGCEQTEFIFVGGGDFEGGFLALPDGNGVSYETSINVSQLQPGATINSASDFQFVCIDMEHSWLGDLQIQLICPNGQTTILKSFPGGGGSVLGFPIFPDDFNPTPGTGLNYCFSNTPDFGLLNNTPNTYFVNGRGGRPEGSYTPQQSFDNFIGCPLNGNWTLRITDNLPLDNGFVFGWSIGLGNVEESSNVAAVTQPTNLTLSGVVTPIECNGDITGAIDITVFGATPPYNFSWTGPNGFTANTADLANLAAGTYTLNVVDANGCAFGPFTYTVTQPNPIEITSTIISPTCNEAFNGGINVSVVGGTTPYTFNWALPNGGVSDAINLINIGQGNYTLTVTDVQGCSVTETINVTAPNPILLNPVLVPPTCEGDSNGSITINPSGGTAPYTILWTELGLNSLTISNLLSGVYNVVVTDANGCLTEQAIVLISGNSLSLQAVNIINATCNNADGGAEVSVVGGTEPYVFQWSFGGSPVPAANGGNTPVISNVVAGVYTVTVVDANGCTNTINVPISDIDGPQVSSTVVNVSCNGLSNGSIQLAVTGVSPFTFTWTLLDGSTVNTQNLTDLAAGNYFVNVSDANGCETSIAVAVTQPDVLQADVTISNISCNGDSSGAINLIVEGGTFPFAFQWTGPSGFSATTRNISTINAGNYTVLITDANGCSFTQTYVVSQPELLEVSVSSVDPSCFNQNNGSILLSVTGGVAPFSFSWVGSTVTTQNRNNLAAGVYTATVTDANNCTQEVTVTLNAAPEITLSSSIVQSNCQLQDGSISVVAQGGVGGFTFNWTDANNLPIPIVNGGNTNTIFNVGSGFYTVTVTDANGCSLSETILLSDVSAIDVVAQITNIPCNTLNNNSGRIDITLSGGTAPFTFSWTGPVNRTTQNLVNAPAGNYTLVITDANGCIFVEEYTIQQFQDIIPEIVITNPTCPGTNNGSISVVSVAGVNPNLPLLYSINFGPFTVNNTFTNLAPGFYNIRVRNGGPVNNCLSVNAVAVLAPTPILATANITEPSCFNGTNGAINLIISGGTIAPGGNYQVNWVGPNGFTANSANISGLSAGNYTATISDSNGCTITRPFTLTSPSAIEIELISLVEPNCALPDGSVQVAASGGTGTLSFQWVNMSTGANVPNGNGGNTNTVSNLGVGVYEVTVTDANGCTQTLEVVLSSNSDIDVLAEFTPPSCVGGSDGSIVLTVFNATEPLTFLWSGTGITNPNAQNQSNLSAGSYTVTLVDGAGCIEIRTFNLQNPEPIEVNAFIENIDCSGNPGSINLEIVGGVPPYSFSWTGPAGFTANTQNINPSNIGTYLLTLTDANNCVVNTSFNLEQIGLLELENAEVVNPSCADTNNGSIILSVLSLGNPITSTWTGPNGFTLSNALQADNLAPGTYSIILSDGANCQLELEFILVVANQLEVEVSSTSSNCASDTGTIDISIIEGDAPFLVEILDNTGAIVFFQNPWNLESISNLPAGTYTVNVIDNNGCSFTTQVILEETNVLNAQITASNISCFGAADGSIVIEIVGGLPPFNVLWNGPNGYTATGLNITQLIAGTYSVTVTDQAGCQFIQEFLLTQPAQLTVEPNATPADCAANNGAINLVIAGGVAPYTIVWADATLTGASVQNLSEGIYPVTVTDSNGCSVELFVVVNSTLNVNVTASITQPSCPESNNGSIGIILSGFTNPTILWEGPNGFSANTANIENLIPGTYLLTVTDESGCLWVASYELSIANEAELTVQVVDATCNGNADGSILLTLQGGTAPFSFQWTGTGGFTASTQNIQNLTAGTYSVSITDANGCIITQDIEINQPNPLSAAFFNVNPTCNESNGVLSVTPTGGTAPYTAVWTNQNGNVVGVGTSITGQSAGIYFAQIFDANGCVFEGFAALSDVESLGLDFTVQPTDCNQNNGSITVTLTSGSLNDIAQITWTGGSPNNENFVSNDLNLDGLGEGIYNLVLVDVNGCISAATLFVAQFEVVAVVEDLTNISCNGANDGAIVLSATGGDGNYEFAWAGPNNFTATGSAINNLLPGIYTVTITDGTGCVGTDSFEIGEPNLLNAQFQITDATTCGDIDGEITFTIAGGTSANGNYLISILDANGTLVFESDSEFTAENLLSGSYTFIITDDNGCSVEGNFIIFVVNFDADFVQVNPSCIGATDGSISFNSFLEGAALTSISWFGPNGFSANTLNISGLAEGAYFLSVQDEFGCFYNAAFTLVAPPDGLIIDLLVEPITCAGNNNGAITAQTSSASATFVWSGPNGFEATGSTITNLAPGLYSVTVTTQEGCEGTASFNLQNPAAISIIASGTPADCGESNGSISIVATGGVAPYLFELFTLQGTLIGSGNTVTGLAAGIYLASVTDANGCENSTLVSISNPFAANVTPQIQNVTCAGLDNGSISLTLVGGNPPFTFNWVSDTGFESTDQNITNLTGGQYAVTITDAVGCSFTAVYTIFEASPLQVAATVVDIDCALGNVGGVTLVTSGGVAPLNFTWLDSENAAVAFTQNLSTVIPGSYTLELTDANGCSVSQNFTIGRLNEFTANAGGPEVTIFVGEGITIGGNPAGPDFANFSWSPALNLSSANVPNPFANPTEDVLYTLTVSTANGCESSDQILVRVLPSISFPNGFSPNGDGINDFWEIDNINEYPNAVVEVYTRWGQLVFRSVGYSRPWDGTFNGEPLPIGTYYYIIELRDERIKQALTGPITILR